MTGSLEQLAERSVAGDRAALEALCRALQGPIYRLAQRMLGHPDDAEDCAQEILVLVVTHLAQFRGDARLTTWVYTIAVRHLLRTRASRAEARPTAVEDVIGAIDAGLAATQDAAGLDEGEARVLARDVQRTCTQAMLLCLSREERIAILLADLLGATDAVGAEICEIAPDAFRQRLARARAKLRPVLEERCGLVDAAQPCRCARGVIAKQRAGLRLPVYRDAVGSEVDRASEQLGGLRRLGHVLGVEPPPEPRHELWARSSRDARIWWAEVQAPGGRRRPALRPSACFHVVWPMAPVIAFAAGLTFTCRCAACDLGAHARFGSTGKDPLQPPPAAPGDLRTWGSYQRRSTIRTFTPLRFLERPMNRVSRLRSLPV